MDVEVDGHEADDGGHESSGHGNPEIHGHGEEKFFDANFLSAIPVVTKFSLLLADNVRQDERHREFGRASWVEMAEQEAIRLSWLALDGARGNEGSLHQFEHEATDIFISYGLMGALTSIAEATEHADADEEALFNNDIRDVLLGLEAEDERVKMPGIEDSAEAWEAFVDSMQHRVIDITAQNFGMSAAIAPFATTYTSATLSNALVERMSLALSELKYAEQMLAAKQDNQDVNLESSLAMMESAVNEANESVNGSKGYGEMSLALAANLQGAGFIGDPPNFFYLKNNGFVSWVKASAWGITSANLLGMGENVDWLQRTLGWSREDAAELMQQSGAHFINTFRGMGASTRFFDHSVKRNQRFADALHEYLSGSQFEDDPNLSDVINHVNDMSRPPFVYDLDGLGKAFSGPGMRRAKSIITRPFHKPGQAFEDGKIAHAVDTVIAMRAEEEGEDGVRMDDGTMMAIQSLLGSSGNTAEVVDKFLNEYVSRDKTQDRTARELGRVLSDLVNTSHRAENGDTDAQAAAEETLAKAHEMIDGLNMQDSDYDPLEQEHIKQRITNAIDRGDIHTTDQLFDELDELLAFMPEHTREAARQLWALQTDSDVVDPDNPIDGLSESSKEVLAALATQILAANAVAEVTKKLLSLSPEQTPFVVTKAAILALAEGLSGVADNVVAYIFAENVLLDQYKKKYGEDVFEGSKGRGLKDTVTSSALFAAVAGGAFSKIGNGPNFKYERAIPKVVNGKIEVEREHIYLGDTLMKNKIAHANGVAMIGMALGRMWWSERHLGDTETPSDEADTNGGHGSSGEDEHGMSGQQQPAYSRRDLINRFRNMGGQQQGPAGSPRPGQPAGTRL